MILFIIYFLITEITRIFYQIESIIMDPVEWQAWQLEQFCNLLAKIGMVSLFKFNSNDVSVDNRMWPHLNSSPELPLLRSDIEGERS